MKSFKHLVEMAFKASEMTPYAHANQSTHDVSQMKLKGTEDVYFVKFASKDMYDDITDANIHPIVEYLAYKIYRLLGVKVPDADLVVDGRVIGLASKAAKGRMVSHNELIDVKNIKDLFIPSAFLSNWDFSGTGYEAGNLIIDNGKATLIDPGGSLTFRAQGGRKRDMFSNEVGEVETLRDEDRSQGAVAFKGIDVTKSLKSFLKTPWSKISKLLKNEDKYIKEVLAPVDKNLLKSWNTEYKEIYKKLEARYKDLINLLKSTAL